MSTRRMQCVMRSRELAERTTTRIPRELQLAGTAAGSRSRACPSGRAPNRRRPSGFAATPSTPPPAITSNGANSSAASDRRRGTSESAPGVESVDGAARHDVVSPSSGTFRAIRVGAAAAGGRKCVCVATASGRRVEHRIAHLHGCAGVVDRSRRHEGASESVVRGEAVTGYGDEARELTAPGGDGHIVGSLPPLGARIRHGRSARKDTKTNQEVNEPHSLRRVPGRRTHVDGSPAGRCSTPQLGPENAHAENRPVVNRCDTTACPGIPPPRSGASIECPPCARRARRGRSTPQPASRRTPVGGRRDAASRARGPGAVQAAVAGAAWRCLARSRTWV